VGDVEELDEVWDTLDTCYDQPEKYIAKALEPVIMFRMYKVFAHTAIKKILLPSKSAMMGARGINLLRKLINGQILLAVIGHMPQRDWNKWQSRGHLDLQGH
jgi:hypothetical protein